MEHGLKPESRHIVRPLFVFFLLALFTGLAYWNSLHNGFALDDESLVEKNSLTSAPAYWPRLFTSDYWAGARDPQIAADVRAGRYRPFLLLTFALQRWWGGLDPAPYHAVNVALHLGVTYLVYLLAIQIGLTPLGSLLGALLFAVHPLHTEPVNMVVGRAELLMSLGVLTSLLWAIQGRRWLSLTAFTLALLSKEQAAVLPLLLVLYQYCLEPRLPSWTSGSGLRSLTERYAGYGLVLGVYFLVRATILGQVMMTQLRFFEDPASYLPWNSWLLTVIKAAGFYIRLSLWPTGLSADYSYDSVPAAVSLWDLGVLFALLSWGLLFAIAWWSMKSGVRRAAFLVGFMVVTFLPGSNLLVPMGTLVAERVFYLPSAGLCLLAGLAVQSVTPWLLSRLASSSLARSAAGVAAMGLCGLLALVLILRTTDRNRDWVNTESVIYSVLQLYPNNAKAHAWMGQAAVARKDWDSAMHHYDDAFRIYPDLETDPSIAGNRALVLVETGRLDEGVALLQRAISREPTWSELQRLLGIAYAKSNRYPEAAGAFHAALDLNPDNGDAHFGLSYIYLEQRNYESAIREAEAAVMLRPEFMEPHYIRARAMESLGRDGEAIEEYGRVLSFPQPPADVAERFYRLRASRQDRR